MDDLLLFNVCLIFWRIIILISLPCLPSGVYSSKNQINISQQNTGVFHWKCRGECFQRGVFYFFVFVL